MTTSPGHPATGPATGVARDDSEGMDYLMSLPRRTVTVYLPLLCFLIVLLFRSFGWGSPR